MKQKFQQISVLYRYLLTYCAVILLTAALISALILTMTAGELRKVELETQQNNLELISSDMQTQYEILESISVKIQVLSCYRPAFLASNQYTDAELLEDFSNYQTYSPICNRYFMFYRDQQTIYTSEGKTSRFLYYVSSVTMQNQADTEKLYDTINNKAQFSVIDPNPDGEWLMFVFPVRFYTSSTLNGSASVVFLVQKSAWISRLEKAVTSFPACYAIELDNQTILSDGDFPLEIAEQAGTPSDGQRSSTQRLRSGAYRIAAQSESGMFSIQCVTRSSLMESALLRNRTLLLICLVAAALLLGGLAIGLAYANFKPIQRLSLVFGHGKNTSKNELMNIEDVLNQLENSNQNSLQCLKEQLLMLILNGNYSCELLNRWSVLNVQFPHPVFCVFVLDQQDRSEQQRREVADQIADLSDEDMKLYAVVIPEEQVIAVIANMRYNSLHEDIAEYLQALDSSHTEKMHVFSGHDGSTAHKLALSYQEALSICKISRTSSVQVVEKDFSADSQYIIAGMVQAIEQKNFTLYDCLSQRLFQYVSTSAPSLLFQKYICYDLISQLVRFGKEHSYEIQQQQISSLLLVQDFAVFLHDLYDLVLQVFGSPTEEASEQNVLTDEIRDFIAQNMDSSDFSLETLSEHFRLSTNYMGQLVKKLFGHTYKEYITIIRIEKAKELLVAHPEMTVNEISQHVGYRKTSNFIQKFKENTGVSPLNFRMPTNRI